MEREQGEKVRRATVCFTETLYWDLKAFEVERKLNFGMIVRKACREFLERQKEERT